MSASFAGLMSTRTCCAKASGHGDETMQLETQVTRRLSDMNTDAGDAVSAQALF